MTTNLNQKDLKWLFIGSLLIGILTDYLFNEKSFGVSFPIHIASIYAVFLFLFRKEFTFSWSVGWFLLPLVILLSLTPAIFSNDFLLVFNYLLIPLLFLFQTVVLTTHEKKWYSISFLEDMGDMIGKTLKSIPVPFTAIVKFIQLKRNKKDPGTWSTFAKIMIGLLLSFPLVVVVIQLLASADQVFENLIREMLRIVEEIHLGRFPIHALNILLFYCVFFAYFWALGIPKKDDVQKVPLNINIPKWDNVITVTILFVINIVYGLFTAIQISYLTGNVKSFLPSGVTFADYAKQGFTQINVVTIINLLLLLLFLNLVSRQQPNIYRIVKILLSFLTISSCFMLFSAHFRLYKYEEAYGFTIDRLLPHAFMLLLLAFLLLALIKIWNEKVSLIRLYFAAVVIWYVGLNYVNMDKIIVKNNIERYHETGQIDIEYLGTLSFEVVPELMKLRDDPKVGTKTEEILYDYQWKLKNYTHWESFNFSKYQAQQELKKLPPKN